MRVKNSRKVRFTSCLNPRYSSIFIGEVILATEVLWGGRLELFFLEDCSE